MFTVTLHSDKIKQEDGRKGIIFLKTPFRLAMFERCSRSHHIPAKIKQEDRKNYF